MGEHSKLGASSYYRWKACPGSVKLCEGVESVSSSYADDGTKAHDVAARVLLGENAFAICNDDMMIAAVVMYEDVVLTDYLNRKNSNPNDKQHLWVEQRLDLSEVVSGAFGTADALVYDPYLRKLFVYDFKYGSGQHVEVENNLQLQYYALGAVFLLDMLGYAVDLVECVIVQPRCKSKKGLVRRWGFHVNDLLLDFQEMLIADADATMAKDAPLVTGRHCWWCPKRTAGCPAHLELKQKQALDEFSVVDTEDNGDSLL